MSNCEEVMDLKAIAERIGEGCTPRYLKILYEVLESAYAAGKKAGMIEAYEDSAEICQEASTGQLKPLAEAAFVLASKMLSNQAAAVIRSPGDIQP